MSVYTIVIVDDESIIRRGLRRTIETRGSARFSVVGSAGDSEEALAMIMSMRPDIIVTDIKMPGLSGIDLIKSCRAMGLNAKVLFVSGYDDFNYAKSAVQLGASGYLLKPVNPVELIEYLERVAVEIEKEKRISVHLEASRKPLLQHIIEALLSGEWTAGKDSMLYLQEYTEPFVERENVVVVFQIDQYAVKEKAIDLDEREKRKKRAYKTAKEYLSTEYRFLPYYSKNDQFVFLLGLDIFQSSLQEVLDSINAVCDKVCSHMGTSLTAGIGNIYYGLDNISQSYREARVALSYKHIKGCGRGILFYDVPTKEVENVSNRRIDGIRQELINKCVVGDESSCMLALDSLKEEFLTGVTSLQNAKHEILNTLLALVKRSASLHGTAKIADSEVVRCQQMICAAETVENALRELQVVMLEICRDVAGEKDGQPKWIIRGALEYMKMNYSDVSLRLQDVADHLFVNPMYLSALLNKEIGKGFSDCLTEIRIKKSLELMRSPELKVYEIAEKVGYSSLNYFSQCFKKYTGYSPRDYRERIL